MPISFINFDVGPFTDSWPTMGEIATLGFLCFSINFLILLIERIGSMLKKGLEGQKMIPSKSLSSKALLTASVATGFLDLKEILETFGLCFCLTK